MPTPAVELFLCCRRMMRACLPGGARRLNSDRLVSPSPRAGQPRVGTFVSRALRFDRPAAPRLTWSQRSHGTALSWAASPPKWPPVCVTGIWVTRKGQGARGCREEETTRAVDAGSRPVSASFARSLRAVCSVARNARNAKTIYWRAVWTVPSSS